MNTYDPSEIFWKNLYTKEDMMRMIVWRAKDETEFNKDTKRDGDRIIEALKIDNTHRVLDFGCGIGRLSKYISEKTGAAIAGVDVSQPMINQAKEYCNGTNTIFANMVDGYTLPVMNDVMDRVFSHIVLQHINKYKVYAILKEFFRVMKPGARAFIQLPELTRNMHEYDGYARDYLLYDNMQMSAMNFWTELEIKTLLEHIGFNIVFINYEKTDMFILFEKGVKECLGLKSAG